MTVAMLAPEGILDTFTSPGLLCEDELDLGAAAAWAERHRVAMLALLAKERRDFRLALIILTGKQLIG